jgi:DNA invertase Pin-like site-specific DNA recombinase
MLHSSNAIALFSFADHNKQSLFRDFASAHKLTIVGFFALQKSSTQALSDALSYCLRSDAQFLLIDEPKTLALAPQAMQQFLEELREKDISLGFITWNCLFDKNTLLVFVELLYVSQEAESKLRSQRIKKALKSKKRKGHTIGGKKFGRNKEQAAIIEQIVQLYKDGLSLQKICALLTQQDIRTEQNKSWHPTTIKRIIDSVVSKKQ